MSRGAVRNADDVTDDATDDPTVDLVVDVANVMGSRPDGWWRDRAGAAGRLVARLAGLTGESVCGPDGPRRIGRVLAVVEGRARDIPAVDGVELVRAPADGDTSLVEACRRLLAEDPPGRPFVVTADRGLRERLPAGTEVTGPRRLLDLLP